MVAALPLPVTTAEAGKRGGLVARAANQPKVAERVRGLPARLRRPVAREQRRERRHDLAGDLLEAAHLAICPPRTGRRSRRQCRKP